MRALCFSLAVLTAAAAAAQEPVYVQLEYVSVDPAQEAAYLALARDVWQPVHAERRRRGEVLGWQLYRVQFAPPGTPHDFVTATVYRDLIHAEGDGIGDAVEAAHPGQDAATVIARTRAARDVVHREIWALITTLAPTGTSGPSGRHLAVNFMAVPDAARAEYFAVENEIWAPIHQVRSDDGSMGGWSFYSLVLPRGAALPYQFGTVDFFDDLDEAAAGITDAQIGQAHPGHSQAEIDALMERTDASRAIYKTEVWTTVAALGPPDG